MSFNRRDFMYSETNRQQILALYGHPQDRLVRENERKSITTVSRTHAWVLEQKGEFPKRKKLGASCAWLLSDLLVWIHTR
ncbi:TPA: AlpA family phage regulatory protein [Aeromonas veronii]|nr:AlpA family phage regulatory protein [Aeromonas veronii]HDO1333268.1 AlpA family phage regulatory protein [Aeromonas veronii]HDO1337263.1 AlpA family phage regulatory protein [Aeromonas veronii]HDO1342488.1 AlpA family phage regulatory protein [Aeromonas veronii]HDO1346827.1 AlpA family phage regulatory protein [Aeromonas veronii]